MYNPDEKRELIMKHYSTPQFKKEIANSSIDHFSQQCVDELHIEINGNKITWDGIGCAVFQSSTDIFISKIQGSKKEEIIELIENYENMINGNGKEFDVEMLGKLLIFVDVKKHLNRLHCANMVSQAFNKHFIG
ncbi:MAG: iron-sulfur cluster assembly scaffold protein [Mycoplasmataceae bacterium]|nr:iron-sulfur cluster assembly scaffold protein [Mycoplasmataceae bacterium]